MSDECLSDIEIEKYSTASLDETSLQRIEKHLNECELCAHLVRGYQKTEHDNINVNEITSSVKNKLFGKTNYFKYSIAASILIVFFSYLTISTYNPPSLFSEYYSIYQPANRFERSSSDSIDSLKLAYIFYQKSDFKSSIEIINNAQSIDSNQKSFVLGLNTLAMNDIDNSIKHFSKVTKSASIYSESLWYKSLAHIKLEQYETATNTLKKLNSERSSQLLSSLLKQEN